MKQLFFVFFLVFFLSVQAQEGLFTATSDTIYYKTRFGSNQLDSFPDYAGSSQVLNPGGFYFSAFGANQHHFSQSFQRLSSPFISIQKPIYKYTSIPHLSFAYTFGSKGMQQVGAEYQQQFTKRFGINIHYSRSSIGEMIRKGSYKNSEVSALTKFQGSRFRNENVITYFKGDFSHHGGLDSAESIADFPLTFLSVKKSNAKSSIRQFEQKSDFYIAFNKDSLKQIGLFLNDDWRIQNRVYTESDSLALIYDSIYIDSFATRDQFQLAKIQGRGGLYLSRKNLFVSASYTHAYWNYQNNGFHLDTIETGLDFRLMYRSKSMFFKSENYKNFDGAAGEWHSSNTLAINANWGRIDAKAKMESLLPSVFQRYYSANNFQWKLALPKRQQKIILGIAFKSKTKIPLDINAEFQHWSNPYLFLGNQWRNDSISSLAYVSVQLKTNLKKGAWFATPAVTFLPVKAALDVLPDVDARLRLGWNKKLFKDKKFDFLLALDGIYQNKRNLLAYNDPLGLYTFSPSVSVRNKQLLKLDATMAFQIDEFRFYVKAENMQYIGLTQDVLENTTTPITPFFIRVGLTWDFFN